MIAIAIMLEIEKISFAINTSAIVLDIKKSFMTFFIFFLIVSDTLTILNTKAALLITILSQNKPLLDKFDFIIKHKASTNIFQL